MLYWAVGQNEKRVPMDIERHAHAVGADYVILSKRNGSFVAYTEERVCFVACDSFDTLAELVEDFDTLTMGESKLPELVAKWCDDFALKYTAKL